MEQHKEPDIQLEQWNPPVKEWGPVYKAIFRAFSMIWRAGKVETVSRAFMRDAQILILDESTAALDAESEYALFQRFKTLTQGVTTLLIFHRFSTVHMADRILVIDEGKILEEGTHEQLMNKDGRYATLYRMQSEKYQ